MKGGARLTKNMKKNTGDDSMGNAVINRSVLDLNALMSKKSKIVSSKEALKDVKPIDWSDEVLRGEKKVTATKAKD